MSKNKEKLQVLAAEAEKNKKIQMYEVSLEYQLGYEAGIENVLNGVEAILRDWDESE